MKISTKNKMPKYIEQFPKNLAIRYKIWYCYLVRIRFGRAENFFIIFLKMIVKKLTATAPKIG